VSASIADDSDFDLLMRQTWHVSPPDSEPESDDEEVKEEPKERQPAFPLPHPRGRAEKEEREAPAQPPQVDEWKYLQSVLLPPRVGVHTQPTLDDVCRRLGVNRVWGDGNETMNTRAFVNALVRLDRQLHSKDAHNLAQYAVQCSGGSSGSGMVSLGAVFQLLMSPSPPVGIAVASGRAPTTGAVIVERIRSRLLQRLQAQTHDKGDPSVPTFLGLNALQRTLRILDTNGDKRLSKDELKLGLRKVGVEINFHELDQLFTCLDADRSGCVDMDEFLVAMRGGDEALTKNSRRLALVHKAFDLLDRDRDGSVTLQELSHAYDTSKHPEVLAGRLSAQEALRQFAQQWDALDKDGVITRREFEVYYRNVSALVDSDDYFELMMRNAWHISGGLGQCANTSNRRVLVTNADGSQSVQEIQDDLCICTSDRDKIHDKLRAQGVYAQAVTTSGAVEDETQRQTRPPRRREARESPRPGQPISKPKEAARPHWGRGKTAESKETARAGRSPSEFLGSAVESGARLDAVRQQRHEQRQLRERAALLIQAQFRGFKCRKFVDCVRRQMAAEAQRKQRADEEKMTRKRVVSRAALKSYYGF
jgi:calcyphosin